MSANSTGPQRKEVSRNCTQLLKKPPTVSESAGRTSGSTTDCRTRSPSDPVSTRILSIVWQSEVPGRHTVTVVKRLLVDGLVVPLEVLSAATFGPAPEGYTVKGTDAVEWELAKEVAINVTGVFPVTLAGAV